MKNIRPVYLVSSQRIPFAKSMTHYIDVSTNELMTASLTALVQKNGLQGESVGDVALGALMNSGGNWNLARECVLSSGLSASTPAYNVQRACGTSLETVSHVALKIATGMIEDGIAGGVDSNSAIPIEVSKKFRNMLIHLQAAKSTSDRLKILAQFRWNFLKPSLPAVVEPRTGLSMGQHCELMAKEWGIEREAQDRLALQSHWNAEKSYKEGFYADLVVKAFGLEKDVLVRGDSSFEKLKKLRPAFDPVAGTLTAGNSTALTDGSAAVLLASESACKNRNWKPLARLVDFQVSAVDFVNGAGLLMAPTIAVARMLERNQLKLQDFDYYEIHEAFAAQVLCTLKAWQSEKYCREVIKSESVLGEIDVTKLNMKGSSLAVGHPFAATGARIVGTLGKMISEKPGRGLISICTAGGMGVTAIMESV